MDNKILEILIDIQKDVKEMKIRQEEDHLVLKALEHNANVTNAEQENIKYQVIEISRDVKEIRKDLSNVEVITASNWSDIAKLKAVE